MTFRVEIDPQLPEVSETTALPEYFRFADDPEKVHEYVDMKDGFFEDKNNIDVKYFVHGDEFSEGSSNIASLYLDLCAEWVYLQNRQSHEMDLLGCPQLGVLYEGDWAQFYSLFGTAFAPIGPLLGKPIPIEDVRKEFRRALLSVWSRMQEITKDK